MTHLSACKVDRNRVSWYYEFMAEFGNSYERMASLSPVEAAELVRRRRLKGTNEDSVMDDVIQLLATNPISQSFFDKLLNVAVTNVVPPLGH